MLRKTVPNVNARNVTFMGLEISTYSEFRILVSFNMYDIFLCCLVFEMLIC